MFLQEVVNRGLTLLCIEMYRVFRCSTEVWFKKNKDWEMGIKWNLQDLLLFTDGQIRHLTRQLALFLTVIDRTAPVKKLAFSLLGISRCAVELQFSFLLGISTLGCFTSNLDPSFFYLCNIPLQVQGNYFIFHILHQMSPFYYLLLLLSFSINLFFCSYQKSVRVFYMKSV